MTDFGEIIFSSQSGSTRFIWLRKTLRMIFLKITDFQHDLSVQRIDYILMILMQSLCDGTEDEREESAQMITNLTCLNYDQR